MSKWLIMFAVGLGMAASILLNKSQLNRGANWPSVSLSHNTGVWISLGLILLYQAFVEKRALIINNPALLGGIITGVTATVSVWYLVHHGAGETMVAIRATASVSVLLLSYFLLNEAPTIKQWVGFALVILGTLLL
jgi:drug/metabolite transporter (DMT)-like permease